MQFNEANSLDSNCMQCIMGELQLLQLMERLALVNEECLTHFLAMLHNHLIHMVCLGLMLYHFRLQVRVVRNSMQIILVCII